MGLMALASSLVVTALIALTFKQAIARHRSGEARAAHLV